MVRVKVVMYAILIFIVIALLMNTIFMPALCKIDFIIFRQKFLEIANELSQEEISYSNDNGRNALKKVAELFNDPGVYNLATNNCDFKTSDIVMAADKFYDKRVLPNDSFTYTTMYHTNYWVWLLNQATENGGY